MPLGLLSLAQAAVQLAETEMTVGSERAHPELLGPGEGLAVLRRGRLLIRRVGLRGDLAEETSHPGLVAALLLAVREVERAAGDFERALSAAVQQMRLREIGEEERMVARAGCPGVGERLLHDGHAFREATHQRICIAEMPAGDVEGQPHLGDPTY